MITNKNNLSVMIGTILCATLLPLTGCNKKTPDQSTTPNTTNASTVNPTQSAYVPPTADQLYQMVGPIALFPDKLVAQVLAGSTYPDQITVADHWIQQNKNLTPAQLQNAANQQPWDVSIKGLVMFPDVLDQMAKNIQWTTALGTAYVNDPTDVMNAIQVMRQRATASGNLKASKQQKITVTPRAPQTSEQGEPYVINPPDQTIVIEPADPDVVYVPYYNSRNAYGEPMQYYPGYQDYAPPPAYNTQDIVTAGALTFGVGIAIAAMTHHDGGWNSWGVHWGGNRHGNDESHGNGEHRPAVEYNHSTYVSRSTTIANNNTSYNNSNNRYPTNNARSVGNHDISPNNAHNHQGNHPEQPNFAPQNAPQNQVANKPNERPNMLPVGQPNFNNMQKPHFGHENDETIGAHANTFNQQHEHGAEKPTANVVPMTPTPQPNLNNTQRPHFNPQEHAPNMTAPSINNTHPLHGEEQSNPHQSAITPPPHFGTNAPNFGHHEPNNTETGQHPQISQQPPQQHEQHQWQQPQVHVQPSPPPQMQQPAQHPRPQQEQHAPQQLRPAGIHGGGQPHPHPAKKDEPNHG